MTQATSDSPMLQVALDHAHRGFRVFPCYHMLSTGLCSCGNTQCASPGKHPLTSHGCHDASTEEKQIRQWWERWPEANVAIATGRGLIVIDIDPRHFGDENFAALERRLGSLPPTVRVLTGGGGWHIYLRTDREVKNSVGEPDTSHYGIDVRGDGGYVMAPGSNHESGRAYAWEVSSHPDDVVIAVISEAWLSELSPPKTIHTPPAPAAEIIIKGGRNNTLSSLAGTMRNRGLSYSEILPSLLAVNRSRCSPPLDVAEVKGIARSYSQRAALRPVSGTMRAAAAVAVPPPDDTPKPKSGPVPADGEVVTGLRLATERDRRPDIPLVPDVHITTNLLIEALRSDPELYHRAGSLVHVVHADGDEAKRLRRSPGSPYARVAPTSYLGDRISTFARCVKRTKDEEGKNITVHVPPPKDRVLAVAERGQWPGLRELVGIIEAPAMRPDGSIIQDPGYDASTGYLYAPSTLFPEVDAHPSKSDCTAAFARLVDVFRDFPYVNGSHLSATISAILTLLARPAIDGSVPAYIFDASAPRSGKTLQVDAISIIVSGRTAARVNYPDNDEELEKVLAGYAQQGAQMVNFDNIARLFGSPCLDAAITAVDTVEIRLLGKTGQHTLPWRAVVCGSGNNVGFRGDMLARVLVPRLETNLDNPETRTDQRYPELREHVRGIRAELVYSALTLLRGYVAAGRPDMGCARWGGFESWSRLIPQALRWVGADDPMGARRGLSGDEDAERVAMNGIIDGWRRLCQEHGHGMNGMTVKQVLTVLYPSKREGPPDGFDDLREALESVAETKPGFPPSPRRVGETLRKYRARPLGGRRLVTTGATVGALRWRVVTA